MIGRLAGVAVVGLVLVTGLTGCRSAGAPEPGASGDRTPSASASGARTTAPQPTASMVSVPPQTPPSVVATEDELEVSPPQPIGSAQEVAGLEVRIASLTAITTQAQGPGEVSGPGLSVEVALDNKTAAAVEVDSLVVTMTDSAGMVAEQVTSGWTPVSGTLQPGEQLTAVFIFTIATDVRSPVTIEVTLPDQPVLLSFQGDAPTT